MKRFHFSLSVKDLSESVKDYTKRLGQEPHTLVRNVYAMWRTDEVNFSVVQDPENVGKVRDIGFEDDDAPDYERSVDVNGVGWERFSSMTQDLKITLRYGVPVYLQREEELIGN